MGRTGRKREGTCIMLMSPEEEKKYNQAKETYAKIQKQVTLGARMNYFETNPTTIPKNYKPTMCRKNLTIGTHHQPTTAASTPIPAPIATNKRKEQHLVMLKVILQLVLKKQVDSKRDRK